VLARLQGGTVPLIPVEVSPRVVCDPSSAAPAGISGMGVEQVPGVETVAQAPSTQDWPSGRVPQSPPQPSSPHARLLQCGAQLGAAQAAQPAPSAWAQVPRASLQESAVHATPSSHGAGPR